MFLLRNPKVLIVIVGLVGAIVFFFPENDEKYLKKTTLKIMDTLTSSVDPSHIPTLMKKVRQVNQFLHFSIELKLLQDDQVLFERKSISEINSLLVMHFKRNNAFTFQAIEKKDIKIQFSETENKTKKAQVSFSVRGQIDSKDFNCQMKMDWNDDKEWLMNRITGFCV